MAPGEAVRRDRLLLVVEVAALLAAAGLCFVVGAAA
jgi:hypothetical protein